MGNFALKTEDDYVVPEAQRVNAQKKRRQLVLLDESIHAIKLGFNERVLALRDLKRRMIEHMKEEQTRLNDSTTIARIATDNRIEQLTD